MPQHAYGGDGEERPLGDPYGPDDQPTEGLPSFGYGLPEPRRPGPAAPGHTGPGPAHPRPGTPGAGGLYGRPRRPEPGHPALPGPPAHHGRRPGNPPPRYAPAEPAEQPRGRTRTLITVAAAVLLVIGLGTFGWSLLPDSDPANPVSLGGSPTLEPTTAMPTPASATPSPTPTPTPTPKPIKKKKAVAPKPTNTLTKKPPKAELPPPPPSKTQSADCPTHEGTAATKSEVRAALASAAGTNFWAGVAPPEGATLPAITIPVSLMNAIAFTESSWVSNVIACDGGIGTMQVMPDTAVWMNNRFGTNHDVNTLSGNTKLGATYLEWLIAYFGLYYFGTFDLDQQVAVGAGDSAMRLRDAVIAAYNVGPYALENDDDTLSIPNQRYVDRVVGYIANCPCDDS